MAEYQTGGHTKHDIKYHLVWITKYRYKILRDRDDYCRQAEVPGISGAALKHPPQSLSALPVR